MKERVSKQSTWLLIVVSFFTFSLQAQRIISADYKDALRPTATTFNFGVGAGRANEGLRADWQQQLAMTKKDIGFRYIRFHGLLHDDMGLVLQDKQGNILYNFQYIDALFDYLVEQKVRPFVELSFMPSRLASGTKTFFWWKGNVTPPKSFAQWNAMVDTLVRHWQQRYGGAEIEQWYYEVWNEPNLKEFWDGDQATYFKLYENTARTIRNVNNRLKVGGPATAGGGWINELINYCDSTKTPLDFLSTHMYALDGFVDELGTKKTKLNPNKDALVKEVDRVAAMVKSSRRPDLPIHYTEWSSSWSFRDNIHDTYQQAAYVLNTIRHAQDKVASLMYWTFTDIFEEGGPMPFSFHGGFGMMNQQGVKKPVYHAYSFLNQLGETELRNTDTASWVCKKKDGSVQVLLYEFTMPDFKGLSNQEFFSKEQKAAEKEPVVFILNNLPKGRYRLSVTRIGYRQNDPFTAWTDMGQPAMLTKQQVDTLKKSSAVTPLKTEMKNHPGGRFRLDVPVKSNDVVLINLQPN